MKIVIFCFLCFWTIALSGQQDSASVEPFEADSHGIIFELQQSISSSNIEEVGLMLSQINKCEFEANGVEDTVFNLEKFLSGYSRGSDSILVIEETDSSLFLKLRVVESSHLTIFLSSFFDIDEQDLEFNLFQITSPMSHTPRLTPHCIELTFKKVREQNFHSVRLRNP